MSAATMMTTTSRNKALHIGLWVAQILLALAFLAAGLGKLLTPIEELAKQTPYVTGAMGPLVPFIGVMEVLGAIGLIVPAATRIKPILTPLAAVGLMTVMVLAAITHIVRAEYAMIAPNLVLGGIAAFVAWGRMKKERIEER